jgi:TFIIF-interacting CTD phosphatase-like protein
MLTPQNEVESPVLVTQKTTEKKIARKCLHAEQRAHTRLSRRCLEFALEVQMILTTQQLSKEESHVISNLAYGEFERNAVRGYAPLVIDLFSNSRGRRWKPRKVDNTCVHSCTLRVSDKDNVQFANHIAPDTSVVSRCDVPVGIQSFTAVLLHTFNLYFSFPE